MDPNDRFFRVSGFKFCETLNNASFDSMAYIEKWGTTVAGRRPTTSEFTDFVDNEAKRVMMVLMAKNRFLSIKEIGRFACYCVAEGSNSLASISPTRLLNVVDPLKYFKGVVPAFSQKPSRLPGPRRKYKLGVLLMVHGDSSVLENIKFIVDEMDDGSSILLIHVDLHSEELYQAIAKYIEERDANMNAILRPNSDPQPGNVHLAEYRYHGRWGHISLVWIQLSGFWELLDLADFQHAINLSGFNVPLRKGREIQRVLGLPRFAEMNFISHWGQYYHMAQRLTRPHLPRLDKMNSEFNVFHPDEAGLMFPPYPLLVNSPKFRQKIINDNKHYLTFPPGNYHPKFLDMNNAIDIGNGEEENEKDNPRFLFARKVDVRDEGGREFAKWISKEHLQKHLKPDYDNGTTPSTETTASLETSNVTVETASRIFSKMDSAALGSTSEVRYVRAQGFRFCENLNNASFDSMAYIPEWGKTVAEVDPSMEAFVELVESRARKVMMKLIANNKFLSSKETGKLACYCAADGANNLANLSKTRLVHRIDPSNYFQMNIPNYMPSHSSIPGPRRKYQLAYLLMIHGDRSILENVKFILDQLDDGSSITLIHVDLQSEELYYAVQAFLYQREADMNAINRPNSKPLPGNVFMATNRYRGRWGHISLVWMQLAGFYELMDMADWHHIINLSAFNVPLRKSREIHRVLDLPGNREKNFVAHWGEYLDLAVRITRPHLPRMDKANHDFNTHHPNEAGLMFPPFPRWKVCKHHQWVILSREFIEYIRQSEEVAMALAFTEQTWIPDESFFCYVLLNTPKFTGTVVNDNKHFLTFPPDKIHPKVLNFDDRTNIGDGDSASEWDNPKYFFARKIDIRSEEGKRLVEWVQEKHIRKHISSEPTAYNELGGEEWVVPADFDPSLYLDR
ncbi:hypothetical protein HDU67_003914 [Dinochytrium kinnereticum]|nr:hypothetical protein HDU67_003914 [Dinochytrium kinnereticum]